MSETFGVWELLTRLGQDELGETLLAVRRADQRRAVLRRFSPAVTQDVTFYGPLKLELALAAQLHHHSAAALLEHGELAGRAFAAFEHVDGASLVNLSRAAQATGGWPLPFERAVCLIRPVLEALAAAHALTPPLLHREVVPHNVLVTCEGRVVLTDFGLGRARRRASGAGAGMRAAYLSPEQARGNATDPRSEVFAAGLILFELGCGRLPALGGVGEVISRIATGELDLPLAVNPQLDPAAAAVLERALGIGPQARFASAQELIAALEPWRSAAPAEPLGAWVTRLDGVKLEPPGAPLAAAASVPPHDSAAGDAPPAPVPKRWGWRWRFAGVAIGLAAAAGAQLLNLRPVPVDPSTVGRPLELTSIPSGAQVYLDGELQQRRTPLTLSIPKDVLRLVTLKKQGVGSWTGPVSNARKLEVTIATGAREEDRYEGFRPVPKPAPEPAATAPLEPPKPEVVFDAESPPLETVLTAAHSVAGDLGPSTQLAPGARIALIRRGTVFSIPTVQPMGRGYLQRQSSKPWVPSANFGSYRPLGLFALKSSGGAIEVIELGEPVTFAAGGEYHLFSPTESNQGFSEDPELTIDDQPLTLSAHNLLRVGQIDSFLIRVLKPALTYRLELTRADGSSGPLPPVLVSMAPSDERRQRHHEDVEEYDSSVLFDRAALPSGQVIAGAGVHTLSGAKSVWFSILTGQGVAPAEVKLSIRPASAKELR